MNIISIHFHSNADKTIFVRENVISSTEIIRQGPAFIEIIQDDNTPNYARNFHVYSVEVVGSFVTSI